MCYYALICIYMQTQEVLKASYLQFGIFGIIRKFTTTDRIYNCTPYCEYHSTITNEQFRWQKSLKDITLSFKGQGSKYGHLLCSANGSDHGIKKKQVKFWFNRVMPLQRTGYTSYHKHIILHSIVVQWLYMYVLYFNMYHFVIICVNMSVKFMWMVIIEIWTVYC